MKVQDPPYLSTLRLTDQAPVQHGLNISPSDGIWSKQPPITHPARIGDFTTYLPHMLSGLLRPIFQLPDPWKSDMVTQWNEKQPVLRAGHGWLLWNFTTWDKVVNDLAGRIPLTMLSLSDIIREIQCISKCILKSGIITTTRGFGGGP